MAGQENLQPFSKDADEKTKEKQREIQRLGGIASGEAKRKKREAREILELMLGAKLPPRMAIASRMKSLYRLPKEELSVQAGIIGKLVEKALKGDINAFDRIDKLQGWSDGEGATESVTINIIHDEQKEANDDAEP
ncbi:MAG: hypothetical protein NC548_49990 [Lachnospiraceae bacterium]|nr:hypothetical protein [Lachnospiraceae bacterium]